MGYTRGEIEETCRGALRDAGTFYRAPVVNYRGRTEDTDELYNEIVAGFLLDRLKEFAAGIPTVTRRASYKTPGHDGKYGKGSGREEEIIAMQMFAQSRGGRPFAHIGTILDYQTPLKSSRGDVAGKIDLLAYDESTLYILELKKPDSEETMLRCVLEGYTYLKTVDHEKLLRDFALPPETGVVACPFVFRGGAQQAEMGEDRPKLRALMALLNSRPYYISKKDELYFVTEG